MKASVKDMERIVNGKDCKIVRVKSIDELIADGVVESQPMQPSFVSHPANLRTWTYTLPWPPSVNTYWSPFVFRPKSGKGIPVAGLKGTAVMVRMILSEKGRTFKANVENVIDTVSKKPMTPHRLSIVILLYGPDKREYDVDNRVKSILDAMQASGAFVNDAQIDTLVVTRKEVVGRERARAEVTVTEIS